MLIGISGKLGSGKDTAAQIIQRIDPTRNWKIVKMAGVLKQIASLLTGVPVEKWEDQEFKKQLMPAQWVGIDGKVMTYRQFLQRLGTEAIKRQVCEATWVNVFFSNYKPVRRKVEDEEYVSELPNWIITDLRFPNELEAIKSRGGVTMGVTGREVEGGDTGHASEHSLDGWALDCWAFNLGSLEYFEGEVKEQYFELLLPELLDRNS